VFALIQSRSRNPLLPLRIVTNRNRACFVSIGIAGAADFAVFSRAGWLFRRRKFPADAR